MKMLTSHKTICFLALIVLLTPLAQLQAGQAKRGISGDWQVNVDYKGQQMPSILSISQDKEGKLAGKWIGSWGVSELTDIKREGKELNFAWSARFGDSESRMNFEGLMERGKLSGVLSSDRGEFDVEGKRLRRVPMVMGNWETKLKMGEREFTAMLVVKADEGGKLAADWQSQWGEHEITDVNFKGGKLTFKRNIKTQDRQWESTFEGTIKGHTLSGTIKSERGDITAEGKRVGAALVGQWELEVTSDSGSRTQLLRVNPDLSGIFGPIIIKKIDLNNGEVAFKRVLEFGEQKYEISFTGKLDGRKLTGELTSSRGTRQVTGEKIRRTSAQQRSRQTRKPSREPDVIFVPTPQEAVDKMLELAEVKKDDLLYDLGCGNGIIVVTAAKRYGCKAVGYDIDRKRVKESLANVEKNNVGHLVRIEQRDIFTLDLSKANVITLYLLPELNVKLIPQLKKLKPGSRIVSHDFDMRGVKPDKVVEVNSEDEYDKHTIYLWTTPLKAKANVPSIQMAAQLGDVEKVKVFLKQGKDINVRDESNRTALDEAVRSKHKDVAKFLIEQGADVNAKGKGGYTPLYSAIWNGDANMVELLISKGADVNYSPEKDYPPLHYAVWAENMDITRMLLDHGAKSDVKDQDGRTAFGHAIGATNREMVDLFVAAGADVNTSNATGATALHIAAGAGRKETCELLIVNGAELDARALNGQTPLHLAAQAGHLDVVQLLVKSGADVNVRARGGRTALDFAQKAEHSEIVKLLRNHGTKD